MPSIATSIRFPALLALAPLLAVAADAPYTLFNPVPRDRLRDLSTDRPDQTESPYTVDAGHVQVELDLVHFTYDHDTAAGADIRTRDLALAPLNLKVGLSANTDLQVLFEPFRRSSVRNRAAGAAVRASGPGDLSTRLKVNLWGNDGGPTALALMPFVKWPLPASDLRNGETEGGLIVPFALELPGGWTSTLMTETDFVADGRGGHDIEWLGSITFAHGLTERLGGYVEFVAVTGDAPGFAWQGQLDLGLTYAIDPDTQLDCGCNFGVTRSAPDYQPFVGLSRRF